MLIEVFKSGAHTDSAGNTRTWTEEDLDTMVQKYDPAHHEAPVVIGHPKDNAPAYGWVEGLERKGGVLYAKLKDLVPEFVDAVKKGLYKKRSISLYPDMTLRHVGFLGAVPPAVKGLADVAFSDADGVTIEIEEGGRVEDIKTTFEGGQEMDRIQELEIKLREAEDLRLRAESEFAEKLKEAETLRLRAESEAKALKLEVEKVMAEKRKDEFNAFCEGLMKEGRLTPAMKSVAMDFMEIMSNSGEFEFSEGDGKTVKAQPIEKFKAFLCALPKQVEFSEMATKGNVSGGKERDALIADYMEKNKGTTYKEAFKAVAQKHPEAFV